MALVCSRPSASTLRPSLSAKFAFPWPAECGGFIQILLPILLAAEERALVFHHVLIVPAKFGDEQIDEAVFMFLIFDRFRPADHGEGFRRHDVELRRHRADHGHPRRRRATGQHEEGEERERPGHHQGYDALRLLLSPPAFDSHPRVDSTSVPSKSGGRTRNLPSSTISENLLTRFRANSVSVMSTDPQPPTSAASVIGSRAFWAPATTITPCRAWTSLNCSADMLVG